MIYYTFSFFCWLGYLLHQFQGMVNNCLNFDPNSLINQILASPDIPFKFIKLWVFFNILNNFISNI